MVSLLCPDGYLRWFPPGVLLEPAEVPGMEPCASADKASSVKNLVHTTNPSNELQPVQLLQSVQPSQQTERDMQEAPGDTAAAAPRPQILLDCWANPSESDRQQMERLVAHSVQLLQHQGVTLPSTI